MSLQPENLAPLFDVSRDPVLGIGPRQTVIYANPAAAALLGAQVGAPAAGLVPEHILSDPAEQFIASLRLNDRRANVSVRRMDGLTVCIYTLPGEEPPARRPTAAALQELSSSLMTARMAMDALIRGTKAEDDPKLRETAETLYRAYFRMLRTCRHMTYAAAIHSGGLPFSSHVTDLGTVCKELCDTVGRISESLGISVCFKADFGMHLTMADRELVEIMLLNLLTNSIAHAKKGDTVKVELSRQGDRFILSVQDPGSGISPEKMTELFNDTAASQTDTGAGLGLYIARGVAERHGGSMILESREGRGTSVRVSIPCRQCDDLQVNTPVARYRSDGMNNVLMEMSVLLDKKHYNRKMFD